jgi:LuxR family transcriptional regulator, maltose regulon positive regulatory protein
MSPTTQGTGVIQVPRQRVPADVPAPPPNLVLRDRLTALLHKGVAGPLTLVTAPAGTGKTVAVAAWTRAARPPGPVVWVRWDSRAGTLRGFWRQLVAALRSGGIVVPDEPPADGSPRDHAFLFALAALLMERRRPLVLVIDADAALPNDAAGGLDFLLRHADDRLRLVLLTRDDPSMPRYRYQLSGALTEITMPELAFAHDEAAKLLGSRGLDLPDRVVEQLVARTEGWAVGLVLAAVLLTQHSDPLAVAETITGDSGPIGEYLLDEVLDAQPPGVRRLLLRTSVVRVMERELVEELVGPPGSRALAFLVNSNAFIEPVPGRSASYRYHPLFGELLRARFAYEDPEAFLRTHWLAAAWYARNGRVADAVRHAISSGSWVDAASYAVDGMAIPELLAPVPTALSQLLQAMPRSVPGSNAALVRAALAAATGDRWSAGRLLAEATRDLGAAGPSPAQMFAAALVRTQVVEGPAAEIAAAATCEQLVPNQPAPQSGHRPTVAPLLARVRGSALVALGDLRRAARAYAGGASTSTSAGSAWARIDCLGHEALIAAWTGRLRTATELADQALDIHHQSGEPTGSGIGAAETALAWVGVERQNLPGFRRHAIRAEAPPPTVRTPLVTVAMAIARSRALGQHVEYARARSLLENEDLRRSDVPAWLRGHLQVEEGTLLLSEGDASGAAELSAQLDAPAPEALLLEAQVALARGQNRPVPDQVLGNDQVSISTRISGLLTESARLASKGEELQATRLADKALCLAAPEGLRRPVQQAPGEVHRLFERHPQLLDRRPWLGERRSARDGVVVESLTPRELEVLFLVAGMMSNDEIAGRIFVSVNTVRTHVRSILRKLGATKRSEAVRVAKELGILPPQI